MIQEIDILSIDYEIKEEDADLDGNVLGEDENLVNENVDEVLRKVVDDTNEITDYNANDEGKNFQVDVRIQIKVFVKEPKMKEVVNHNYYGT